MAAETHSLSTIEMLRWRWLPFLGVPEGYLVDPRWLLQRRDVCRVTGDHKRGQPIHLFNYGVAPSDEGRFSTYSGSHRSVVCVVWPYDGRVYQKPNQLDKADGDLHEVIAGMGDVATFTPSKGTTRVGMGPLMFSIASWAHSAPLVATKVGTPDAREVTDTLVRIALRRLKTHWSRIEASICKLGEIQLREDRNRETEEQGQAGREVCHSARSSSHRRWPF